MYRKWRDLDGLEEVSYKTNARPQSGSALTPYRVMDLRTAPGAVTLSAEHLRRAAVALCQRHQLLRCRVVVTGPPPATPKGKRLNATAVSGSGSAPTTT